MSHFTADLQQRPTMRRKSSAQNLLSSFKSPSSVPATISIGSTNNSSFATASGTTTPTTSIAKESDAQSLYTDTTALSHASSATSPQLGQGTSVEYLRDLVQKRIITLTYIRNIHEGRSHWFHTILISRADLEREFSNNSPEIRKRTTRFAILGMSLSNLLDINSPQDLLRGLIHTISEYDQNKDDVEKPKTRQPRRLFRPKISKRGGHEYAVSFSESSDASYLMIPHLPFPLDYHQTLLSLLDVISEVYNKISKILGPSPIASQHMMGPLGLLSPHPGVSYILSGDTTPTGTVNPTQHTTLNSQYHSPYGGPDDMSSSLWNIANPNNGTGGLTNGGVLGTPPPNLSASFGESVLKIDGKIRKITSTLLKELDTFARNAIKDELASLDSLLNTVEPVRLDLSFKPGGGRIIYDKGL
ncbi:hypothetical protein E4T56_gene16731 [Termitomyces sp. T112]|nr:hypothetical protein E4T56_gene16731 [Termitomyces sp. T112]KAH0584402.1 hypothetical protein H2248_009945 [Termitomyces sp. 'cryptogamus']KNZ75518.1 hypothetical protein J132_02852 [Termitomyces sp. J132]